MITNINGHGKGEENKLTNIYLLILKMRNLEKKLFKKYPLLKGVDLVGKLIDIDFEEEYIKDIDNEIKIPNSKNNLKEILKQMEEDKNE